VVLEWRADLHTHTTCSDGSLSPHELVAAALEKGLSGLSITDHDSIQAYSQLTDMDSPVELLTGVELTTQLQGESVHILGYGFHPGSTVLNAACHERCEDRKNRFLEMRDNLRRLGLPLPQVFKLPDRALGRPELASELVSLGICRSYQEAFQKYLKEDSPAYVPGKAFSLEAGIELLHAAGAFAVLAHPMLVKPKLIPSILKMPLDGIEAYYGRAGHQAPFWLNVAMDKQLLITGGSDFHGKAKPDIELGQSWTGRETFESLLGGRKA
jgi:predicted metal-dependent phosphoesterase TrpH